MNNRKSKSAALAGIGMVTSSVALGLLTTPAMAAAPVVPTCNATDTDSVFAAKVNAYNAAALANYLKSPAVVAMNNAITKNDKLFKAAKTKAKKAAAKKLLDAAKNKKNAAIAAFKKNSYYYAFSGDATPSPIAVASREGLWNWGTYTTRILVNKKTVKKVCTYVDESAAGNNLGTAATSEDLNTSIVQYQMPDSGLDAEIPGTLPVLWAATLVAPATKATTIAANVTTCISQSWEEKSGPCVAGGLAIAEFGGLTGATYTVNGYKDSLQAALTKAVTGTQLGA